MSGKDIKATIYSIVYIVKLLSKKARV